MDNNTQPPYITLIELSEITKIKVGTLQRRAIRGILPEAVKLGRDWFYPRALVGQVGVFGRGRKLTRVSVEPVYCEYCGWLPGTLHLEECPTNFHTAWIILGSHEIPD